MAADFLEPELDEDVSRTGLFRSDRVVRGRFFVLFSDDILKL